MSHTQPTARRPASGPAGYTDSAEGPVFTVTGGDWEDVLGALGADEERITLNMGPQHPSTHGVLRMVLEIEGEIVKRNRPVVGYLHTGIEKNCEYRTWVQGTTFVTRMDYLSPLFNETAYSLAVEKLLGIIDEVPERASVIRVIMMELCRISSHCVAFATNALEVGALSMMLYGFREREQVLDIFELVTGLRMNHAYVRPGGVAQDMPTGAVEMISDFCEIMPKRLKEYEDLLLGNPIWQKRNQGVGYLDAAGCIALGVTGPMLRAAGLPWDVRKAEPYCGYESYDFDVPTSLDADCWGRFGVRLDEVRESVKIIEQALDRLKPGPVMVADKKIAWPSQLALGADGMGNSLDHIRTIMGTSMEALIHHFKLVTEGFQVPPGQVYIPVESARGELGFHVVSAGGTHPHRVHVRDPSFVNIGSIPAITEGALIADVIAAVASVDPVMGGCDR